ncbi:iron-sulfur assembly protein, putative [Plasmodium gallinaceum]|uniref:Iron-sulfur assembly protein, putative n=1 Tax=Plasmodium gallinaceum TaxID=5849 RepID=A0A1J1GNS3_PLAGA|nr:iron-sulfur assembly protein, putative [Plasmodium gallinaceum]CRG93972.1 iron-sulfur assembly protein, putative [Plasmodium gallinaceum]
MAHNIKKYVCLVLNNFKSFSTSSYRSYGSIKYCNNNLYTSSFNSLNFNFKRFFNNNKNDVALDWENSDDIADLLFEEYKNVDPLTLRFEELENMIVDTVVNKNKKKLNGSCNESVLENIQMNWLEKYNEEND